MVTWSRTACTDGVYSKGACWSRMGAPKPRGGRPPLICYRRVCPRVQIDSLQTLSRHSTQLATASRLHCNPPLAPLGRAALSSLIFAAFVDIMRPLAPMPSLHVGTGLLAHRKLPGFVIDEASLVIANHSCSCYHRSRPPPLWSPRQRLCARLLGR